jgi:hypothetical protein
MHIPRFWARNETQMRKWRWGWSDQSLQDAQRNAEAQVAELARKLESGAELQRYPYGNESRPLREEVVQLEHAGPENGTAVITRNRYGALVLNTANAMFIDVDFETHAKVRPGGGFLRRIFHKPTAAELEKSSVEQIRQWAKGRSDLGLRLYRTFAGIRCLVTNRTFEPASAECMDLLNSIGSDPLYVRLCKGQESFRARLTPKPWRCGAQSMAVTYPRTDAAGEAKFEKWKAEYEECSKGYTVCRFLEEIGLKGRHAAVEPIVGLHDQFTIGAGDAPLA